MRVEQSSFSTKSVPPDQRAAAWRVFCRDYLGQFRVQSLGTGDLGIEVRTTRFAQIEIFSLACAGTMMERAPDIINTNRSNTVMVTVILRGKCFLHYGTEIQVLTRGDASLYDLDVPCAYGVSDDFFEAVISLPRETFIDRYGDSVTTEPTLLRSPHPEAVAERAEHLLQVASDARESDPATVDAAIAEALRFLDSVLGPPSGSATGHWIAAIDHIRANLHDSRLGRGEIASAVGVSERQLSRIFAARGTTVAHPITDERMREARDRLTDPRQSDRSIFEIAQSVGYQSPSHFARSFRRAFGTSAQSFRSTGGMAEAG